MLIICCLTARPHDRLARCIACSVCTALHILPFSPRLRAGKGRICSAKRMNVSYHNSNFLASVFVPISTTKKGLLSDCVTDNIFPVVFFLHAIPANWQKALKEPCIIIFTEILCFTPSYYFLLKSRHHNFAALFTRGFAASCLRTLFGSFAFGETGPFGPPHLFAVYGTPRLATRKNLLQICLLFTAKSYDRRCLP